jgi:hypothetical protein
MSYDPEFDKDEAKAMEEAMRIAEEYQTQRQETVEDDVFSAEEEAVDESRELEPTQRWEDADEAEAEAEGEDEQPEAGGDYSDEAEDLGEHEMAQEGEFETQPFYKLDPNEASRLGAPRHGDESLGTIIEGGGVLSQIQERLTKVEMSPEQQFDRIVRDTVRDYSFRESLVQNIKELSRKIKFLKYRNAKAVVLGFECLKLVGKKWQVSDERLWAIYRQAEKKTEAIAVTDLLRYALYIQKISNEE